MRSSQPKTGCFRKSSRLAIIDVRRERAAAIRMIGSATDTWLQTISTGPVLGMCSVPYRRIRSG